MKKILLSIIGLFCWAVLLTACGGGGGSDSSGGDTGGGGGNGGGGNTTAPTEIYINVEDVFAGKVWSDVTLKFSGVSVNDDSGSVSEKIISAATENPIIVKTKGLTDRGSVIVTAQALGYLDTGASVVVSEGDDRHEINLKMVKNSPGRVIKGIYNAEMDISAYLDETGTTTEKIELTSKDMTDSSNPGPGVSISIPKDTTLLDSDDMPVTDGVLRVTSFDPYEAKARAAFPGGFNVQANANNFVDNDGNAYTGDAEINFKTAGFAAISIESDAGQKVRRLSHPLLHPSTISMDVKQGTTDPKNTPVDAGTTIPVWSYDEDTGKWAFEDTSTAMTGVKGGFGEVSLDTNHLTYWNLDWHTGSTCSAQFNFLLPNDAPNTTTPLNFVLNVGSNPTTSQVINNYQLDGFLKLYNVPDNILGSLEVYDEYGNLLQTIDVADFCDDAGNGVIIKTVIIDPPMETSQVNLDFACPGGVSVHADL